MKRSFTLVLVLIALQSLLFIEQSLAVTMKSFASRVDSLTDTTYYLSAKFVPVYKTGNAALNEYLRQNFHLPKGLKNNTTTEHFVFQFIIERHGNVSNIELFNNTENDVTREIARLLSANNNWVPGISEYKNVRSLERTLFVLPIDFAKNSISVPEIRTTQDSIDHHILFSAVDTNPAFEGGENGFGLFLRDHIRYPKLAKEKNVTGKVFIQFVVEEDGSLSHAHLVRDPGKGLGDESMRVLRLSPKWIPGIKNGKPVRVAYTVPINFSLAE
ncbi:MAG: energy transducer TonB [Mucilaginibacter sp.]|uniref:energy transducer TonB n=1 Tax=Mucilaginibacter sp. TaxID=1882438 RepID=UPI003263177B